MGDSDRKKRRDSARGPAGAAQTRRWGIITHAAVDETRFGAAVVFYTIYTTDWPVWL
jgi:hypothetical protein